MSEREETRWRQVDALFARALSRPEAERAAFVARECAADARRAEAVHRLLDAATECDAFWRNAARQRSVALRETLEIEGRTPGPSQLGSDAGLSRPAPPDRNEGTGPPVGESP